MRVVCAAFLAALTLGTCSSPLAADIMPKESEWVKSIRRKAEQQGDAMAQIMLGGMYERGTWGVWQDREKATKWYRRAFKCFHLVAEQGDPMAQYWLGGMYKNGIGTAQNHKRALRWYRLAAEQGDANAQYLLGLLYSQDPQQDNVQAYKWIHLSMKTAKANRFAKEFLSPLTAKITSGQVAEAKRLARKWDRDWKRRWKGDWRRMIQEREESYLQTVRCEW